MKYWEIVFKSEWITGLVGSLILIGMLIPFEILNKNSELDQLTVGLLIGVLSTMIAFGMSLMSEESK